MTDRFRALLFLLCPCAIASLTWALWAANPAADGPRDALAQKETKSPAAQPLPAPGGASDEGYTGLTQCAFCHERGPSRLAAKSEISQLNEAAIWFEKDKHAQAAKNLVAGSSPLLDRMERQLGQNHPNWHAATAAECLACHAVGEPKASQSQGVTCEACHGKGQSWYKVHQEKDWLGKRKTLPEMIDVRDPLVSAARCLSCHLGNQAEGKLVTHEMFAAGHPPLPGVEVAAFTSQMPPHWTAQATKPKAYRDEYAALGVDGSATKQILIGSLVGLRSYLQLLADYAADVAQPWPELALYDCYACHHDLQDKSWRQARGYPLGRPGRPPLRPWPSALAKLAAKQLPAPASIDAKLKTLNDALGNSPFGQRGELQKAAADGAREIQSLIDALAKQLKDVNTDAKRTALAKSVLREACQMGHDQIVDYDSSRQLAWAVRTIYRELASESRDAQIEASLAKLDEALQLNLAEGQKSVLTVSSQSAQRLNSYKPEDIKTLFGELGKQIETRFDAAGAKNLAR